jgi:hypothetical protein
MRFRLRILLFRQWPSRRQQKIIFFSKILCLFLFEGTGTFTSFFKENWSLKEVTNQKKSWFFLIFLLVDGRFWIWSLLRSRIRTNKLRIWMRIQEAQKHMDSVDPDWDQEHWFLQFFVSKFTKNLTQSFSLLFWITYGTGTNFENPSSNPLQRP